MENTVENGIVNDKHHYEFGTECIIIGAVHYCQNNALLL